MPRQVLLDASSLHAWSVRGLLLGLADRDPPIIVPRWAGGMLAELADRIGADLAPRLGAPAAAEGARRMVNGIAACFPDAEVAADAGDLIALAAAAGAEWVVTGEPDRVRASGPARRGVTVLRPDDHLVALHHDDPWRVLHATMLYAFILRRPDRSPDDLLAELARSVPGFVGLVRRQVAGLPLNQPPGVFAVAHREAPPPDDPDGDWWCLACDPFPCPGHGGLRLQLWGTPATSLPDDECCFVGVSQTAQHRTLVWPSPDDRRLKEITAELGEQCRNPRPVPYTAALGPAVSYWEWQATGSLVHGIHESPPPAE